MKRNLRGTLLYCLVAVSASLGGHHASAAESIDFIEFARGTKDVAIGGITVRLTDRPAPMTPDEIKALFADVIENDIIKKVGMNVISKDMYWATVLNKKLKDEKISQVLNVTGVLTFYSREDISELQQKDIAILSLYSSKVEPNQDEDRFSARVDVDPKSLEYGPLLFTVEPEKLKFEKQLRDALLTKLRGEIVPILCFDTPRPEGCEEIALPPPTKKDGVSPPQ
jgi:hypothetical protein